MTSEYDILFDIFNDINITLINNNLSMKDKIIKKIDIIKKLSHSNINVLNYNNDKKENLFNMLKSLNYKLMSVKKNQNKLNSKLNTILGMIIHNAYISTGYHVLLSNIPNSAKQVTDNKINRIDAEAIYDTIIHYIKKNDKDNDNDNHIVLNVCHIDSDKYLVKFKDDSDAETLCNLINNMMIEPNIIRAEMLKNMNETYDDYFTFEDKKKDEKKDNTNVNNTNTNVNKIDIKNMSLFNICISLVYEKVNSTLQYVYSFFQKNIKY